MIKEAFADAEATVIIMSKKIVAFGEIMLRLSPENHILLKDADTFSACYGGSESNVLVALTSLGDRTEYVSVIPDNDIGNGALNHLRRLGVGTKHVLRTGDALGMYFLEVGFGERPSKVIYNRRHAAITEIDSDALDYGAILDGCALFHVCGISLALSDKCREAVMRLVREASSRSIPVSFDFNYRSKLWDTERAGECYREIMPYVDICFGNAFDLGTFLGIDLGDTEASVRELFRRYGAKYLCFTEKRVISSTEGERTGHIYAKRGDGTVTHDSFGPCRFEILDRIGAGDSFCAGVLHVLIGGGDAERAVRYGTACCTLKHTLVGDILTLGESDIESFLSFKTKEVQR